MALLEAETGCTVDWRPVNGGDIRKLRRRDPFEGEPVSGQYDWSYRERDARLWADFYGIRFREPPSHHFDFWLLARAATAAKRLGRAADYGWRICAAAYGTDAWPIDETICIALAEESFQQVRDVELIRHAYVLPSKQRHGFGGKLLRHLRQASTKPMLVGTWAAATWAIRFYERHGFALVSPQRKTVLLNSYWTIPERQIETSVVLASPPDGQ